MSGHREETSGRVPAEAGTLLSIGEVAEATGISVDTLRAWERRYGRPRATRLPSGHRRYTMAQVRWLRRVAEALAWGFRPSRVVQADDEELAAILEQVEEQSDDRASDEHELLELVRSYDGPALTRRLEMDWRTRNPLAFLEERITPLLARVGRLWADGQMDIRHEHFLTELMQDLLRSLRVSMPDAPQGTTLVLATLPDETHGVGLQMLALLCALHGVRAHMLGTDTPLEDIAHAAEESEADAVVLSVSLATGGVSTDRLLGELRELLPADVRLLVGGAGARGPRRGRRGIVYLETLGDFDRWLDEQIQDSRREAG